MAIDQLIGEVTWLKGVVFDAGNVADGVVEIFEVLQHCSGVFATGLSVQTTVCRVVRPATEDKITGLLLDDLVGGVVLRIKQHGLPLALAADQQLYLPKVPGQAVARSSPMAAGVGLLEQRAERAEHMVSGERLAVVERAGFAQRLAGQGKAVREQRTGTVFLFQQLAAAVVPGLGRGVGVSKNVDIGLTIFLDRDHPQLLIEARAPMVVALIPALQWLTGQTRQGQAPTGVDAVGFQYRAVQAVNRGQAGCRQARIPLLDQTAGVVMLLTGYQRYGVVGRHTAQVPDLPHWQTTRIAYRQRRCTAMHVGNHGCDALVGDDGSAVSLKSSLV